MGKIRNIRGEQVYITKAQARELRAINLYGKVTVRRSNIRLSNIYRNLAKRGLVQVDWTWGNNIRYKKYILPPYYG